MNDELPTSASWSSLDLTGLLEAGPDCWPEWAGQTRTGQLVPARIRQLKPIGLPKSPTHRRRHQALAWLLIPLLATRWELDLTPLAPVGSIPEPPWQAAR